MKSSNLTLSLSLIRKQGTYQKNGCNFLLFTTLSHWITLRHFGNYSHFCTDTISPFAAILNRRIFQGRALGNVTRGKFQYRLKSQRIQATMALRRLRRRKVLVQAGSCKTRSMLCFSSVSFIPVVR